MTTKTQQELLLENQELRLRLAEAEETLNAIRQGHVDALVTSGQQGDKILTLDGTELPYRKLMETMSEGAITVAEDGLILYSNPRLADWLNTPLKQLMGASLYDFVPTADKARLERLLSQGKQGSHREEITLQAANGRLIPCHLSAQPLEFAGFHGVAVVVTDLSEVMIATETRRRLAAIVQSSNDAIISKDLNGIITSFNTGAERLYGYTAEEVIGRPITILAPPERHKEISEILEKIKKGQNIQHYETVRLRKDGQPLQISLTVSPLKDLHDEIVGASAIARDITERKRAEQALRASETFNREVLSSLSAHIAVLDQNGVIVAVNQAWERFARENGDPTLARTGPGMNYLTVCRQKSIKGDEGEQAAAGIEAVLAGTKSHFTLEYPCHSPKVQRWFLMHVTPLSGEPGGVVVAHENITERKLAEMTMFQNEERFRALIEHAPDAIAMLTAEGTLRYISPANKRILGYDNDEIIAFDPVALIHPNDQQCVINLLEDLRQKPGSTVTTQYRVKHQDGSWRWIDATINNLLSEPSVQAFVFNYRDITAHKAAEAARHESEQRYRALVETSPDAIILTDMDYKIELCNQQAANLLGCVQVDDLLGQNVLEFLVPEEHDLALENVQRMKVDGGIKNGEFTLLTREGQPFLAELSASLLRDVAEQTQGLILVARDITKRKRVEEALKRSEASLVKSQQIAHLGSWELDLSDVKDINRNKLYWSDEVYRIFGYSPGEVEPSNELFFQAVHPDDRRLVREAIAKAITTRTSYSVDHRIVLPGGTERIVHEYGDVIYDEITGKPQQVFGIVQDVTTRKQAEAALEENRRRLQALFDNTQDAILLADDSARYIEANPAACSLLGYSRKELLQLSSWQITPGVNRELGRKLWQTFLASGQQSGEYTLVRKDGTLIETDYRAVADIVPGVHLSVIRNITDQKRREEEIRRRNLELALLNQVIAASAAEVELEPVLETVCRELALTFEVPITAATLLNDEKTAVRVLADYYSPELERTLGQQESDFLYRSVPLTSALVFRYLATYKTPLVVDDIQVYPRLTSAQDLLNPQGTVSLLALPIMVEGNTIGSLVLETTEPRHFSADEVSLAWSVAEQVAGALARVQISQTYQRLSAAVEQAAESVIITNTEHVILYVNPAFERISGYSAAEVLGRKPSLVKSGQHDDAFYQELKETLNEGDVWRGRFINRNKRGELYTEDVTITPVRNESGAVVNFVSVQRDVTRELQLEQQYQQAQRMDAIGQLSGGIAHDFNNLLVVINGYSELLLERHLEGASPVRKYIEEIHKAGERAAGLTRQLLAFSRQQVLQPQVLAVNEIVTNMGHMLRRLIGEDIDMVAKLEPGLGQVVADAGQIEQIILNLAVNARDAMPRGGKLTIETANTELDETYAERHAGVQPGPYVLLAVSDTGTGMDAATQARIFEPFFTTKERGKGTGLGLATVYGIVKQSGGEIWVYSEVGQGTTFKIYLPRVDALEPDANLEPGAEDMLDGSETVLLVEDEDAVRALARQVLEMSGYHVLEAEHGQEALQLVEQRRETIHLLVTDVIMPHMSGRELAERLVLLHPETKVLYISGYTDHAIEHHGVLAPGLSFLQKPFTPTALLQKIREVLEPTL